jgi:hypothetical protein
MRPLRLAHFLAQVILVGEEHLRNMFPIIQPNPSKRSSYQIFSKSGALLSSQEYSFSTDKIKAA